MQLSRCIITCLLPVIISQPAQAAPLRADSSLLVARRVVELLPDDLRSLLTDHMDDLCRWATTPDTVWPQTMPERENWHYLHLDAFAKSTAIRQRLRAARRFPPKKDNALKRCKTHDIDCGLLPWVIADLCTEFSEACAAKREEDVVRLAGLIVHFAADAAQPYNATVHLSGAQTGNLVIPPDEFGRTGSDLRSRFVAYLETLDEAYFDSAVKVTPADCAPADDPVDEVFAALRDSLEAWGKIEQADRDVIEELNITTREQLDVRLAEYHDHLQQRVGLVMGERLREAVILSANIIGGAWSRSQSPELASAAVAVLPDDTNPPETAKINPLICNVREARFVGSKRSNIYHLKTCKHAQAIAAENLVGYKSAEDAIKDGRRPCYVCKPPGLPKRHKGKSQGKRRR